MLSPISPDGAYNPARGQGWRTDIYPFPPRKIYSTRTMTAMAGGPASRGCVTLASVNIQRSFWLSDTINSNIVNFIDPAPADSENSFGGRA